MNDKHVSSETSNQVHRPATIDMKLEAVNVPVSDVDRAKRFSESLGWRLDGDFAAGEDFRAVQYTPLHSQCAITFGQGGHDGRAGLIAGSDADRRRRRRGPG